MYVEIYTENRNWCHYIRAVIHKHNTFVLSRVITENRETSVVIYTRCDSQTQEMYFLSGNN